MKYKLTIKQGSVEIMKTFDAVNDFIPDALWEFCRSVVDHDRDAEMHIVRMQGESICE